VSHKRGQIVTCKDILGDTFYKIFTGCDLLDDFYTTSTYEKALQIQEELKA
jgi:hypothetical protein